MKTLFYTVFLVFVSMCLTPALELLGFGSMAIGLIVWILMSLGWAKYFVLKEEVDALKAKKKK